MTGTRTPDPSSNPFGFLVTALDFAARKHRDQRRKDAEASPYINHPIALAHVLVQEGGIDDPIVLAAALLHDTIEDTETSRDELREKFGTEIAAIVAEVTDDKRLPKQERKRLQIEHAGTLSPRARLIKLADKICNLRDVVGAPPADWSLKRRREYFDWAKAVVDGLRGVNAKLEGVFDATFARRPDATDAAESAAPDSASDERSRSKPDAGGTPARRKRSGWRWKEGAVDRAHDHFELRYGDGMGEEGWADWMPVALVGPAVRRTFPVEFLPDTDGRPLDGDITAAVRRELDFYLIEVGEPDPWLYAQYHGGTMADAISLVHWGYVRQQGSQGAKRR